MADVEATQPSLTDNNEPTVDDADDPETNVCYYYTLNTIYKRVIQPFLLCRKSCL